MNNLKKLFDLEGNRADRKLLIIYILIAYLFSLCVRFFLYYQASENPNYFYNGNIIPLWTADAGLYGYYANQILDGVSYPFIAEYMPGYLLSWIVNISGISLDKIIFFAPAFLSSFVVFPIILMANRYKMATLGLYGALIGSVMTSYYYRTHLGYYDTDILNSFFPLMAIYFLIRLVDSKNILNATSASLFLTLFSLWYHSSLAIILAIITIYLIYILIHSRKDNYAYSSLFLLFISLFPISILFKILLILLGTALFLWLPKVINLNYKHYIGVLLIGAISISFFVDTTVYYERVNSYINKSSSINIETQNGIIKLKSTLNSVKEAKGISWKEVAHRVSGAIPFFFLAIFGYLALLIRYRSMLLTLPLAIITFLSMIAGLRFTLYGVIIFSFAMVFGVHLIFNYILFRWGGFSFKISKIISNIFLSLVMVFVLNNIYNYNRYNLAPTLFSSTDDIKKLDELKSTLKKDDFIMTWWDYGWLLWYYTNTNNTLIDNGKHQEDNFIVSKILLSDKQIFTKNASVFFVDKYKEGLDKGIPKVMDYFAQNYSMSYLDELKKENFKLPVSNRDIYIVLHKYMLHSLGTIESFSNLNLKTGKSYSSKFINMGYLNKKYKASQNMLYTNDFTINLQKGEIISKVGNMKVKKISIIENHKIKFEKNYIVSNGSNIVIYEGKTLLLKDKMFNSFLVQALVFNNYNHDYFEKVSETDNFLILKIKR